MKDLKQENIEPFYISRVGKPPTPANRRPRQIKIVLKRKGEKRYPRQREIAKEHQRHNMYNGRLDRYIIVSSIYLSCIHR